MNAGKNAGLNAGINAGIIEKMKGRIIKDVRQMDGRDGLIIEFHDGFTVFFEEWNDVCYNRYSDLTELSNAT